MLFAAVVNFAADLSKLPEHRPAHRAGLMKLRDEGKLALSGPFGDLKGGLMVKDGKITEWSDFSIR